MEDVLVPIVIMTGMFAMIFGIVYIRSRENMALIEKGLNPRAKDSRPRPFLNLKWGLLLIGAGLGLLSAYIIDHTIIDHSKDAQTSISIAPHHSGKTIVITKVDTGRSAHDTAIAANSVSKIDTTIMDDDNNNDDHSVTEIHGIHGGNHAIYFALIAIGGGLGLFFSYRIEKKEWLDKVKEA